MVVNLFLSFLVVVVTLLDVGHFPASVVDGDTDHFEEGVQGISAVSFQ